MEVSNTGVRLKSCRVVVPLRVVWTVGAAATPRVRNRRQGSPREKSVRVGKRGHLCVCDAVQE
eukprot:6518081-Lingulodinium_polyedra.AAC.1